MMGKSVKEVYWTLSNNIKIKIMPYQYVSVTESKIRVVYTNSFRRVITLSTMYLLHLMRNSLLRFLIITTTLFQNTLESYNVLFSF